MSAIECDYFWMIGEGFFPFGRRLIWCGAEREG